MAFLKGMLGVQKFIRGERFCSGMGVLVSPLPDLAVHTTLLLIRMSLPPPLDLADFPILRPTCWGQMYFWRCRCFI